jgi:hypothetical protein
LELALIQRSLESRQLALSTVAAEGRRYVSTGSDLQALERLLVLEEDGLETRSPGSETERMELLHRLQLWVEAQTVALDLLKTGSSVREATLVLFSAYRANKQSRRALAAALNYNNMVEQDKRIPQIDLDDLRWQHRLEAHTEKVGAFEIACDLERDAEALTILGEIGIAPSPALPFAERRIEMVLQLPPDVQKEIRDLFHRAGELDAAQALSDATPLQQS